MYVKSMALEGFKSYGRRTIIDGFDPAFNAITGLNGSGKSNILDAICFVMGITNLTQVRATNLQELVYKNGQAGITKASVSITFDNRDKKNSPLGYEHFDEVTITRQVVVGGKNKYLINGSNIQGNRVADFFRSVQLNVNNPHFLIMQGRITKVLNMKPPEILAMIEEAVGTMMYETKKQSCQKTIEKKDNKLREINDLLNEEITPNVQKLKAERATYLEFQKVQRELDHLTKVYIAYQFICAEEMAEDLANNLEEVHTKVKTVQNTITDGENQIVEIVENVKRLEKQRDEELGGRLTELEAVLKAKEQENIKTENSLKSVKDSKKQEERKLAQINRGMNTDQKALDEKEKQSAGVQALYDKLRQENDKCGEALKTAERRFEAISMGKFMTEDDDRSDRRKSSATLQQQAIDLKAEVTNAQTKVKTSEMTIEHNRGVLKKKEVEMKNTEKEFGKDNEKLKRNETEVEKAKAELGKMPYKEGEYEEKMETYQNLKHEVNAKNQMVSGILARLNWLKFDYTDPEPNFDRSKVKGVAASLFTIPDQTFSLALEVAASNKHRGIIVETAEVGKKILTRGRLANRVTLLPLDKMQGYVIPQHTLQEAQRLVGRENVHRAIDLIEYDRQLQPAMEYIFGGTLICKDTATAKKVAYHPKIRSICVALDGDKLNPNGEISGGAAFKGGCQLTQVQDYLEANATLDEQKRKLRQLEAEVRKLEDIARRYNRVKEECELKAHELELIRQRLKGTTHHRLAEEVRELEEQCQQLQQEIQEAKETEKTCSKRLQEVEYKIKHAKELKEKEMKAAEADVKKCRVALESAKKKWNEKESEEAALKLEISELQKSIAEAMEQIRLTNEAIQGFEAEIERLAELVVQTRQGVDKAKADVKAQKETLVANTKEISSLNAKVEKITKQNQANELEIKKLQNDIEKAKGEADGARRKVANLLEEHEWIAEDRKFFGQANTAYDFKANNPKDAGKAIQKLQETKAKLEKSVNMRAMTMLGKAEEQYNDLMKKKNTVETDKFKIQRVIEELDEKKKVELRAAWDKVNKDFGSIFSSLLPGTNAKLVPPEGKDVLDGLEVKVAFGGQWKDSLSELSGGQRSLVALSLILALLLFKPAPLYILDEVDAALDLSHTQNIGHMLKTHFQHSQFIVVSLKDGMFNNANVLFRTKFVDGMSCVSRTEVSRSDKRK